jgi:hypothetical protein
MPKARVDRSAFDEVRFLSTEHETARRHYAALFNAESASHTGAMIEASGTSRE